MFHIEQSTFLHALGYAIGHSLWQMSLLWLVYFASVHVTKWNSSRKYIMAVAASLTGLICFVGTFIYYSNHLQIDNGDTNAFTMLKTMPAAVSNSANFAFIYHSVLATLKSLSPYLSCAYLVVMLVLSIRLANGFGQVKQLRSRGLSKPAIDWRLFVKEHARFLGIKKPVSLYISNIASSPLTVGFWKPIILIPLASVNQLSPQQMEAVLLHELAHIRRHDYLLNIILQLAEIALFFNPFMRLLLKQARLERENSCDDWVLQFRYNAADYARALLAIEQHSVQSLLALGTNNHNEFQLLNRVKRMLAPERQSFNYRQQLGLLFLITILGLGFTVIVPRQKEKKETPTEVTKEKEQIVVSTNSAKPAAVVVDLVKNLENIQKISKTVTQTNLQKTTEAIAEKTQAMVEKAILESDIQKQLAALEVNANAINRSLESLPLKEWATFGGDLANNYTFQLSDMSFDPAWFNKTSMALEAAGIKIGKLPGFYNSDGDNVVVWQKDANDRQKQNADACEEQKQKLKALKEKHMVLVREENNRAEKITRAYKKIQDSLLLVQHLNELSQNDQHETVARARKAAAIAPYRVAVPNQSNTPPSVRLNYTFNLQPGSKQRSVQNTQPEDNERPATAYARRGSSNSYAYQYTDQDNECTCVIKVPNKSVSRAVIAIDGRAFSEKVRSMLQNVKKELGNEWSQELQLQVEEELKKELKDLEKLNIKTRVVQGAGNKQALVIEIESNR